jgi:hypothetical protein
MELFILSFVFFGLAALGMAAGVLLKGTQLKGTCATLGASVCASIACAVCENRHNRGVCERQSGEPRKIVSARADPGTALKRRP